MAGHPLDPQFRGYGRATSAANGSYRFVTIQPVEYPGRTPHVHLLLRACDLLACAAG